jgi:hypothetical protein
MIGTVKVENKIKTEDAKIEKIEKVDLNDTIKAAKKIKIHLICIAIGIVATIGVSFAGGTVAHIALIFPALPSIIQEVFDYLYKL